MKKLFLSLGLLVSGMCWGRTTQLSCVFPNLSSNGSILIALNNFGAEEVSLNYDFYTDYNGGESAFSFSGEEELEWLWMLTLSGDGQYVGYDKKGNLEFSLDSDGCDVGKIYLYKNSDYSSGYVKVDHRCSGSNYPSSYSKAKCTSSNLSN